MNVCECEMLVVTVVVGTRLTESSGTESYDTVLFHASNSAAWKAQFRSLNSSWIFCYNCTMNPVYDVRQGMYADAMKACCVFVNVAGDLCWGYVQSSWAAWTADDFRLLTNQNVSHDQVADDWTVVVQRHNSVIKLTKWSYLILCLDMINWVLWLQSAAIALSLRSD